MAHDLQTIHIRKLQIANCQVMATLIETFNGFSSSRGCIN
jgi:hypothetical protein